MVEVAERSQFRFVWLPLLQSLTRLTRQLRAEMTDTSLSFPASFPA